MKNLSRTAFLAIVALCVMAIGSLPALAGQGGIPQASITLQAHDANFCYVHNNTWDLSKEVTGNTVDPFTCAGTVTWTVTATKSDGGTSFAVHGAMIVTNTGTADATIGNIVVNLQKQLATINSGPCKKINWVSIAADVADATSGDAATSANIVAAASQESETCNNAEGAKNYTVLGAQGTFVETADSGTLEFTDANSNTEWAITPQKTIAPGESVTLLYEATFNTTVLPGDTNALRVEALVSFGNAGARGGSGAVGQDIDINGNSHIDDDEAYVRTVPCRISRPFPALEECNNSVTVSDVYPDDITATGTVTTSNPAGFDAFPAVISDSTAWQVSVDVDGGTDGGDLCDTAHLNGEACGGTLYLVIGYTSYILDEFGNIVGGGEPIYDMHDYTCAEAASDTALSCVTDGICGHGGGCPHPPAAGEFCTYTQGAYGGNGAPYQLLEANFATLYPTGVEVGIPGDDGFSMLFTSADAIGGRWKSPALPNYLPAGDTPGPLTADLTDPTSSSSGVLGGQVLALKINVDLSDAGLTNAGFGDVYVYCVGSLDGMTVREILAAAEIALGGGDLPDGYTYSDLNDLCTDLNEAFDNCGMTDWVTLHLCKSPFSCP